MKDKLIAFIYRYQEELAFGTGFALVLILASIINILIILKLNRL